jgi:hypothetical protein
LDNPQKPPTIKGRSLGITILTTIQTLIGCIHVSCGALLLTSENLALPSNTVAYDIYTLIYGLLVLIFALYIWQAKKIGWIGTVLVSLVVIAFDTLTVLDLPSIPGIPKPPAFAEITYSFLIIIYLIQPNTRKKFLR